MLSLQVMLGRKIFFNIILIFMSHLQHSLFYLLAVCNSTVLSWCFPSSHKSKHAIKQSDRVTVTLSTAEAQLGVSPLALGGPEVMGAKVAETNKYE